MSDSASIGVSQFLVFKLDAELFAVEISGIREVLEFTTVTRVPRMPEHMRGVINLRGTVVPVVDMRLKLGLGETKKTVDTCIVICELEVDGVQTLVGALVDSVQEVIDLDSRDVVPPPHMGTRVDSSVIRGMGRREEEFVMVLDLTRVFASEELLPPAPDMPPAAEAATA